MLSQNLLLDRLPCPMMEGNLNIHFSLRKSWLLLVHCSFSIHFCHVSMKKMWIHTWHELNGREKCSGITQTQFFPLLMCYGVIINAKQTHLFPITYFPLLQHHSQLLWGWSNMALGCYTNLRSLSKWVYWIFILLFHFWGNILMLFNYVLILLVMFTWPFG